MDTLHTTRSGPDRHCNPLASLAAILADPVTFSAALLKRPLRPYQAEPIKAIVDSIIRRRGLTFVIMMSRQAGKNEMSAHLEAYILTIYSKAGGTIVKASPTFKPQTIISRDRLAALLQQSPLAAEVKRRAGYIVQIGRASAHFLSAAPHSQVVGSTASLLLECDEAQDVDPDKWDKDFIPMTASTNATKVLYGTPWTTDTLLHREYIAALEAQNRDGIRRVWQVDYHEVARHLPPYAQHVQDQIRRLGPDHPLFLTQYALQTLAQAQGLFNQQRLDALQGDHEPHTHPDPSAHYVAALDIAGEGDDPEQHDETALTIATVEPTEDLPIYRIRRRWTWQGANEPTLYMALRQIIDAWNPTDIAVDATGLGAGLASRLAATYPDRVHPFTFTRTSKSQLGWQLIAALDARRLRDHRPTGDPLQRQFAEQCRHAHARLTLNHTIEWSVPAPGHDDLLISAALLLTLDQHPISAGFEIISPRRR